MITAYAQTPGNLARVADMIGSRLERVGRSDELSVGWEQFDGRDS
jgi:hypothetical protein